MQAAIPIVVQSSGTTSFAGKGSVGPLPTGPTREWRGPKRTGSSPLQSNQLSDGPDLQGGSGGPATGRPRAKSNPQLLLDFEGVNHLEQRLADGGNQFSGEPPDQGLCAGNGFILETVNSALRVFNANTGAPLTPVLSLNEFYGFPPAFVRPTGPFGPFTFDISCHYDLDTNRWFHLAVDLDQDPVTGDFTGKNYLDLAVSHSGDPTGTWTVYRIPGMNDGTEGTPDHNCDGGPCFADFPHIGMDKYGLYITTNEFPLFADGFIGAQVYAISKAQLVALSPSITAHLFNTADDPVRPGEPGFTLWPALSPQKQFAGGGGGTEFFVSSNAVFDDANADSEELILWGLVHTQSIDSPAPDLTLHKTILDVDRYAVPSNSVQKPGTIPLADCLNDTALSFFGIANCGFALVGLPPQNVTLGTLDTGDSRVMDVRYAHNRVWADARHRGTGQRHEPNRGRVVHHQPVVVEGRRLRHRRDAGRRRLGRREPHVPEPRRDHHGAGSAELLAHGREHVPELRIRGDRRSSRRQRRHPRDRGREGAAGRVHRVPADRRQPPALG